MPKNNAYLSSDDHMLIILYDREETIDMFGEDSLDEDGVCIPEELIERYKKNRAELRALEVELRKFKK